MTPPRTTPSFYSVLFQLMVPIFIQQFFISALALVDNLFIGQLGDTAVAATSLANQINFILSLIYFGISSGSAIFSAQYWGNQNVQGIKQVVQLNLTINLMAGLLFTLLAELIPETLLSFFSADPAVIQLGSQYLRIHAIGFVAAGLTQGFYATLRSTENVRVPMAVNSLSLILSTSFGYVLIFGKAGFPAIGITGAAIANATARVLELLMLILILHRSNSFLLSDIRTIPYSKGFIPGYLKTSLPVLINETMWSLGISAYYSIYAHISTESVAATSIATSLENLAFVPFFAIGNATAVMIGNRIGAAEIEKAKTYARKALTLVVLSGMLMGAGMYFARNPTLNLYKVSEQTLTYANQIIIALSMVLWIKCWNFTVFIGILRAGGDTRFALRLEMGTLWLYGVPAAWVGGNLLNLPVYQVVWIVLSEEVLKSVIVFFRFRSYKWIHRLTSPADDDLPPDATTLPV